MKSIRKYYDEYKDYDKERSSDYHNFIRELEINKIIEFCKGKKVLEVGCGTGLVLKRVSKVAKVAKGVDLSLGMLKAAKKRGLDVKQADVTNLSFPNKSFDVVYSLKVLPHVPSIKKALEEISRVTKKNGILILEFYNPFSIKFFTNRFRDYVSRNRTFTRYDTIKEIRDNLPKSLNMERFYGIRIFTPFGFCYRIPLLSNFFKLLDRNLQSSSLKYLAGYFLVIIRKN